MYVVLGRRKLQADILKNGLRRQITNDVRSMSC